MKKYTVKQIETGKYYYQRYLLSTATELWHVYKTCSTAKQAAMEWNKAQADAGQPVKIISHTCNFFTVAYPYQNPETGEIMFRVNTGRNYYEWPLSIVENS